MAISLQPSLSPQKNEKAPDYLISRLGYPVAFHWSILAILAGLLIFAAFKHLVPLLAAIVFTLVLALVPRLLSRYAIRGLSGGISISHDRAFPDEKVTLAIELANRRLPLPWVEIEIEIPYRLMTGKKPASPYTSERPRWVTAISHGQAITWEHTFEAKSRGNYWLGPLRLRSGDMFGLFPRELVTSHFQNLLIYPRILPLSKLNLPLKALFGEKMSLRSLYEDTSLVCGARDYHYDDPLKRVHWKASAAHGRLQTRQYESSTSLSLLLVLDVQGFPEEDEEFEYAVSLVASLAYEADRRGFAVGVITNSEPEIHIAAGTGRGHLMQILEALARITADSRIPIYTHLDRYRPAFTMGATLVVVTHSITPALTSLAGRLERDGCSLSLIGIGEGAAKEKTVNGTPEGIEKA